MFFPVTQHDPELETDITQEVADYFYLASLAIFFYTNAKAEHSQNNKKSISQILNFKPYEIYLGTGKNPEPTPD